MFEKAKYKIAMWHINSYTKSVRKRKAGTYPNNPYGWVARVMDNGVLNAAKGIIRTCNGK